MSLWDCSCENLQDSPNSSARLEGLIHALADFYTYENFMEVFHNIFLLFGVMLIYNYSNNPMSEIDMIQRIQTETNEIQRKVAYLYLYFDSGVFMGTKHCVVFE